MREFFSNTANHDPMKMKSCWFAASCFLLLVAPNNTPVASAAPTADDKTIRPFHVNIPQKEIDDLRKRILATRWPDKETVADASQGVQLATARALVSYWGKDYDWRKCEKKLNSYPQFITNIDGLDIHFIHVRSKNPNALPLIVTHSWPGFRIAAKGGLTNP